VWPGSNKRLQHTLGQNSGLLALMATGKCELTASLSCQILLTSLFEILQEKQKTAYIYYFYLFIFCPHFTNLVKEVANE